MKSQKDHQTRKMEPFGLEDGVLVDSEEVRLENEGKFGPCRKNRQTLKMEPFGLEMRVLLEIGYLGVSAEASLEVGKLRSFAKGHLTRKMKPFCRSRIFRCQKCKELYSNSCKIKNQDEWIVLD